MIIKFDKYSIFLLLYLYHNFIYDINLFDRLLIIMYSNCDKEYKILLSKISLKNFIFFLINIIYSI